MSPLTRAPVPLEVGVKVSKLRNEIAERYVLDSLLHCLKGSLGGPLQQSVGGHHLFNDMMFMGDQSHKNFL